MMPHLKTACLSCKMCGLGWSEAERDTIKRDPHVFSNFDPIVPPAKFMIIGQNPGWNEVKLREPFVGQSGDNFDKILNTTMWRRSDFYITNICKCFTAGNRSPSAGSIERCQPFLRMELAILKPKLVVVFGAVAFAAMCDGKFSDAIGKITVSRKFGVKVFTTYHPSPLNLIDKAKLNRFNRDIITLSKIMAYYLSPF